MTSNCAPGARVLIRDEEWLVRRVDPSSDGGELLTCDGVSELVRGRSTQFLTRLEDKIEILDVDNVRVRDGQIERLKAIKASRDSAAVQAALHALTEAAKLPAGEVLGHVLERLNQG